MSQPVPPADQELLLRLGVLARAADPAPAEVLELGRAALSMRRLDAELAELVADSDAALAGVRGAGSTVRLLTFEAGELVVEAQVSGPAGPTTCSVRSCPSRRQRVGGCGSRQPGARPGRRRSTGRGASGSAPSAPAWCG